MLLQTKVLDWQQTDRLTLSSSCWAASGAGNLQCCQSVSLNAQSAEYRHQTGVSIVYTTVTLKPLKHHECNWTCLLLGSLYRLCILEELSHCTSALHSVLDWEMKIKNGDAESNYSTYDARRQRWSGSRVKYSLNWISARWEFMTCNPRLQSSQHTEQMAQVVLQTH